MESLPRRKLALIVEYDGTGYTGFQFQHGSPTIQGDIEQAIKKVTGEKTRIVGAGRTDAGVHAKGQVVSFSSFSALPPQTLVKALNFYLGADIAVKAAFEVEDGFHARRDAHSREYRYRIWNSPTPAPMERRYAYHIPAVLDIDAMKRVCRCLVGTHDFASFTGSASIRTIREVYKAELTREEELVCFDIEANSFLHKQVRFIVGAMIRVGLSKLSVAGFKEIMEARIPGLAAPVAAPHGLCLMKVNYSGYNFNKGN